MKKILLLWCLTVLPCLANGLVTLGDLSRDYGPAVGQVGDGGTDPKTHAVLCRTTFHSNGLDISVVYSADGGVVFSVMISRDSTFNSMEIPDILKPLSSAEDWTSKDDQTWVLAKGKYTARWNGEGKISVERD
jgi:hypothetical protein